MSSKYYDGTKLLSLKDINGKRPAIFCVTSNRTAGKTTFMSKTVVNAFIKRGQKFMVLYRYKTDLPGVAMSFFKDIKGLFFPEWDMTAKSVNKDAYYNLYLNEEHCGYAVAINSAHKLKNISHMFNDVDNIFFDEFQAENNEYCPGEVGKFQSLYRSIARGNGEMNRYVRVIMCGNPVTLLNPYYIEWGISDKLMSTTRFYRGDGVVVEQGYNEYAAQAQRESAFSRAFSDSAYTAYSAEAVYLDDNQAFIAKPEGKSRYLCTIKYKGNSYSVRAYEDAGVVYCDTTSCKCLRPRKCSHIKRDAQDVSMYR